MGGAGDIPSLLQCVWGYPPFTGLLLLHSDGLVTCAISSLAVFILERHLLLSQFHSVAGTFLCAKDLTSSCLLADLVRSKPCHFLFLSTFFSRSVSQSLGLLPLETAIAKVSFSQCLRFQFDRRLHRGIFLMALLCPSFLPYAGLSVTSTFLVIRILLLIGFFKNPSSKQSTMIAERIKRWSC